MSLRYLAVFVSFLTLSACASSSSDEDARKADARSVLATSSSYAADPALESMDLEIPRPADGTRWAQAGANTEHMAGNPSFSSAPQEVWTSGIGEGSSADAKLLASPIIVDGTVYAIDADGYVSAFSLDDGDRLWRVSTAVEGEPDTMGGGLAWEDEFLYVTTGAGDVLAMHATDGGVIWRRSLGKPLRSAPTVFEGRVFVITVENEAHVIEAKTGRPLWHHVGIKESAALLGSSSPAVKGDMVVLPYSSGEIFSLRTQNGRLSWTDILAVARKTGALPAIADIKGLPVIDGGVVYATSHSGRIAAIDERSGNSIWERDFGGINTPCVIGQALFLVTNDAHLVALSRKDGRIIWAVPLQDREDPSEIASKPVLWFGPVMAGGQLWLTNSIGHLVALDPHTGSVLYNQEMAGAFFLPPVVAQKTMVLLSDDGELIALK